MSDDFKHCDDYINDQTQPMALRAFLERARSPAHGHLTGAPFPKLFATYTGKGWRGIGTGDRVRVVMASRMGDVGVTKNLANEVGYCARFAVEDLSDFGDAP